MERNGGEAGTLRFDPVLGNTSLLIQDLLMFSGLLLVWCIMIYIRRSVSHDARTSILGSHWLAERRFNVSDRPWDYTKTFKTITTTAQWWDWVGGPLLLTMSAGAGMHQAVDFSGVAQIHGQLSRTKCAAPNENCSCSGGRVRFGDLNRHEWSKWIKITDSSPINCTEREFGIANVNDEHLTNKVCQCEIPANTTGSQRTAANVGGVYRLFGGWRIRQVRTRKLWVFWRQKFKKDYGCSSGKRIRSQSHKLIENYYGDVYTWAANSVVA